MDIIETEIPGLKIIQPRIFFDARGFFMEAYRAEHYQRAGIECQFIQDNISFSKHGVLRGLHFQNPGSQGKLVTVLQGEIFDVAVDLRQGSPSFGKWFGIYLNEENKKQFWVPGGFAHGFVVTSEAALLVYKCDAYYNPDYEHTISWDDPDLGIRWPITQPALSPKDAKAKSLREFKSEQFPVYEPH